MTAVRAFARWWVPELPRARVAWVRALLAVMAVLDVRLFLASTAERALTPQFYDPVVIARWLHLPPVTQTIADVLFLAVHLGALAVVVGGFAMVPHAVQNIGGAVLAVAFALWAIWG